MAVNTMHTDRKSTFTTPVSLVDQYNNLGMSGNTRVPCHPCRQDVDSAELAAMAQIDLQLPRWEPYRSLDARGFGPALLAPVAACE